MEFPKTVKNLEQEEDVAIDVSTSSPFPRPEGMGRRAGRPSNGVGWNLRRVFHSWSP